MNEFDVLILYIDVYGDDEYARLVHKANEKVLKRYAKQGEAKIPVKVFIEEATKMALKQLCKA